MEMIKVIFYWI